MRGRGRRKEGRLRKKSRDREREDGRRGEEGWIVEERGGRRSGAARTMLNSMNSCLY